MNKRSGSDGRWPAIKETMAAHFEERSLKLAFGEADGLGKREQTRREIFLGETEQVVPWKSPGALIKATLRDLGPPRPTAVRTGNLAAP